jgi:cytidyltransferase-like protein
MARQKLMDRRMEIRSPHVLQGLGGGPGDLGCSRFSICGDARERCPDIVHGRIVEAMTLDPLLQELREAPQPVLRLRTELPGSEPRVVALLSGSFDPLTIGHVALAEAALNHANLVLLVYSVRTQPKEAGVPGPLLSEEERLAVLEAFCEARPGIEPALCSHGLLAEQVEAAAARFPASDMALVMGSDKVRQLLDPRWYQDRELDLETLFSRANVFYAVRSEDEGVVEELLQQPENSRWRKRFVRLDVPPDVASVSSRGVRERVAAGKAVTQFVPSEAAVLLERRRTSS